MSDQATNPDAGEDVRVDTTPEVADEASAQGETTTEQTEGLDAEAGDGQTDGQPPEDDTEEVERDGKKYRIPKALAPDLLRQADYTRKTQEVADSRRIVAEQQAAVAEQAAVATALRSEYGKVEALRAQVQSVGEVNWPQLIAQAANEAEPMKAVAEVMAMQAQYNDMVTTLKDAEAGLTTKEAEFRLQNERAVAAAMQETAQILAKEIPDWSPKTAEAIVNAGADFGFTVDDFKVMRDPRAWKAFSELARLRADNAALKTQVSRQTTTARHEASQGTTPAKTVSSKSGGYKAGLDDGLPNDEWMRRRNAEVDRARKAAR